MIEEFGGYQYVQRNYADVRTARNLKAPSVPRFNLIETLVSKVLPDSGIPCFLVVACSTVIALDRDTAPSSDVTFCLYILCSPSLEMVYS